MKILIIDECFYTRSGVNTYLNSVSSIKLMDVPTVEEATLAIQEFQPDMSLSIILCNCHRIKGDRSGGHRTR
ncbi:luxR-family regulatory protein [Yersinia pestis Antiqua]|nr:luxR-family regulatory protein [Yersinia pestis Antiqua]